MAKTAVIYYSLGGCTKKVAEIIAKATGAVITEIKMEDPYSITGAYLRGGLDIFKDRLPILKNVFNLNDIDTIYLGGPVWFYTVPPPIRSLAVIPSFADYIDGKKLIPFCTDGGNVGKFFEAIEDLFPEADIAAGREFKHIKKYDPATLKKEVEEWVKGM